MNVHNNIILVLKVRVEVGTMSVFYNKLDISTSLLSDNILMEQVAIALIDATTLSTVFSINNITHSVWVTLDPSVGYLSYALNLGNSPPITTSGLLGTLNGDVSDDFKYPDGSTIPFDASDEMIHDWGQACMFS